MKKLCNGFIWSFGLAFMGQVALAGLPPTTSKGSGDTSNITTFNYQFPNATITHTGTTAVINTAVTPTLYNQQIESNTATVTQRNNLNFSAPFLTAVDDVGNLSTDININATSSATANFIVSRDANGNTSANNFTSATALPACSGTISLSSASARYQIANSGSGTCTFQMPDARTLALSKAFDINNNASGTVTVTDNTGATITTIAPGGYVVFTLTSNSFQSGTWDYHAMLAKNSSSVTAGITATEFFGSGAGITSIPLTGIASIANGTILGNNTGSSASPLALTPAQLEGVVGVWPTATALSGGSTNAIPYQSGISATAFLAQGTGVLYESAGTPLWTATPYFTTQSSYNSSSVAANTQFVQNAIQLSMSYVPLALGSSGGGTYSFAGLGSGATISYTQSGGVLTAITAWPSGGSGYAVGDIVTVATANEDTYIRVTAVTSGAITAGQIFYGGTGFSGNGTAVATENNAINPFTITLSGTLTSNATFIIPKGSYLLTSQQYIINNNTTGSFSTTFKMTNGSDTPTGTGVVIPQGTSNSGATFIETDGISDIWLGDSAINKSLTGYASTTGTITSSDSILTAIEKLNGNISGALGNVVFTQSGGVSPMTDFGGPYVFSTGATINTLQVAMLQSGLSGGTIINANQYRAGSLVTNETFTVTANGSYYSATVTLGTPLTITAGDMITFDVNSVATGDVEDLSIVLNSGTLAGAQGPTGAQGPSGVGATLANTTFATVNLTEGGGATNINWSQSNSFALLLNASDTISFSNAQSGQTIITEITNTASNYTVTWPSIKWAGGINPTQTIGAHTDIYTIWFDGSTYFGSYIQNF